MKHDVRALLPFCESPRQTEILEAALRHGTREAARQLGIDRRNVQRSVERVAWIAQRRGFSPEHDLTHPVPEAHLASGVSTLYDADGNVRMQWVKSRLRDEQALEVLREAIQQVAEEHRGRAKPVKAPARSTSNLMACYPMGDPHIGMLALAAEAGADFDTKIARQDLLAAASRLVEVAPASERALIINLGDYFHADSVAQLTKSGHKLDVDTRWQKVLTIGCHLMVDLISLALQKHQTVEVINAIGNHDDHSSVMLSAFLGAWFHAEPRVVVHPTVAKFHYVEFGKCLIGVTHGDTVKHLALGELMASDQPEAWGRTAHRYWYTGHIHHTSKTELRGVVVESFRTLAAKDAWHAASGYRSGRDMYAIVLDKEFGEVERHRCDIRMVRHGKDHADHKSTQAG